jgi:hypothetical protein
MFRRRIKASDVVSVQICKPDVAIHLIEAHPIRSKIRCRRLIEFYI